MGGRYLSTFLAEPDFSKLLFFNSVNFVMNFPAGLL